MIFILGVTEAELQKNVIRWFDSSLPDGAVYHHDFVTNQQDWVFDQQGYFCQTNEGESTG